MSERIQVSSTGSLLVPTLLFGKLSAPPRGNPVSDALASRDGAPQERPGKGVPTQKRRNESLSLASEKYPKTFGQAFKRLFCLDTPDHLSVKAVFALIPILFLDRKDDEAYCEVRMRNWEILAIQHTEGLRDDS